jgi:hypothetical protein
MVLYRNYEKVRLGKLIVGPTNIKLCDTVNKMIPFNESREEGHALNSIKINDKKPIKLRSYLWIAISCFHLNCPTPNNSLKMQEYPPKLLKKISNWDEATQEHAKKQFLDLVKKAEDAKLQNPRFWSMRQVLAQRSEKEIERKLRSSKKSS